MPTSRTPLSLGVQAARANLLPALIVQTAMIAIVCGYYWHPPTRAALEVLAGWKAAGGYAFSFAAGVTAGALLPELFTVAVLQRGKCEAANLSNLQFTVIYWGLDAILVDAFYRLQTVMFGSGVDAMTVGLKIVVDQFIFTVFIATPIALACYEWKHQGYSFAGMSHAFTWDFFQKRTIPLVIMNWAMWIPILVAVYALPPLLQVPLFALALTLWVMIFTYISKARPALVPRDSALAPQ